MDSGGKIAKLHIQHPEITPKFALARREQEHGFHNFDGPFEALHLDQTKPNVALKTEENGTIGHWCIHFRIQFRVLPSDELKQFAHFMGAARDAFVEWIEDRALSVSFQRDEKMPGEI